VKVNGKRHYFWRAVDHESEVLESFVIKTRDKKAELKFIKKATRKLGKADETVTDNLSFFGAATKEVGADTRQEAGRWLNNRAENSYLPFRRSRRVASALFRKSSHNQRQTETGSNSSDCTATHFRFGWNF